MEEKEEIGNVSSLRMAKSHPPTLFMDVWSSVQTSQHAGFFFFLARRRYEGIIATASISTLNPS